MARLGSKLGDKVAEPQLGQIELAINGAKENARVGRVLIARHWFNVDPYSAAVTGILNSIKIATGDEVSHGMSQDEFDTLLKVRETLLNLDPAARGLS